MGKALLISIIVSTIVAPAIGARDPNGRRGLKRTLFFLAAFNVLYLVLITLVYATYFEPEKW